MNFKNNTFVPLSYFLLMFSCFKKIVITIIVSCSVSVAFCQSATYAAIDEYAANLPSTPLPILADKLTQPYADTTEKVRAIFRWVTAHIEYDKAAFHDDSIYKNFWKPNNKKSQAWNDSLYNAKIVSYVFTNKKAICDGYSRVFRYLCEQAGIRAMKIDGFLRTASNPIGQEITGANHSWNAVYINHQWNLLDPTRAAGYTDARVTKYTFDFKDFYFFTSPSLLAFSHYPTDTKWLLTAEPFSKKDFSNQPIIYRAFAQEKIQYYTPKNGLLKSTMDTLFFTLTLPISSPSSSFVIVPQGMTTIPANYPIQYTQTGNNVQLWYVPTSTNPATIIVLMNNNALLQYKIQ